MSKEGFAMSGNFFLDTNAIIQLLNGNNDVYDIIKDADFIACSIISELEYYSFPKITNDDISLLKKFLERITVVDLTHHDIEIKKRIVEIRKSKKVKLPDAIILASAVITNCQLVTADKQLGNFSDFVNIISF